jgi:hypothetical protein
MLTTLVLVTLMFTSTAWAANDTLAVSTSSAETFNARISLLNGDTIRFLILNPDGDDVVLKVYSDRDLKVMEYDLNGEKALKLSYRMDDMRKCCYTAVVERNDKEVARKMIEIR